MDSKAEEIRIRYLYGNLVLRKEIRLPFEGAVRIVGPDCAYHLYPVSDPNCSAPEGERSPRRPPRRKKEKSHRI